MVRIQLKCLTNIQGQAEYQANIVTLEATDTRGFHIHSQHATNGNHWLLTIKDRWQGKRSKNVDLAPGAGLREGLTPLWKRLKGPSGSFFVIFPRNKSPEEPLGQKKQILLLLGQCEHLCS